MSLRIAWACHRTNISLAIAAQVFVYVGTIILYLVNWFFVQRIVRAQHPRRWGWSTIYRIFHRAALVCLVACLIMLIVAALQPFFTLDTRIRRIDRNLQLLGLTYFSAFSFTPILLVLISLSLPRKGTEKFGAGRLRNAIAILLLGTTIVSIGQIFRCVTMWLPPVSLRTANGVPVPSPWYFSKTCFYIFNFTTEILVVILYAIVRVDLRFHVPDGSKAPGDYAASRNKNYSVDIIVDEKNLKRAGRHPIGCFSNDSRDTLHEYEASIFDDTRTLADSLRYPSSVLEVDSKTGHWKIKRHCGTPSTHTRYSSSSQPTLFGLEGDDVPPMPDLPADWPLRESQMLSGCVSAKENDNHQHSPLSKNKQYYEHALSDEDAIMSIPRAYQPAINNPWRAMYYTGSRSNSMSQHQISNNPWMQKYSSSLRKSLQKKLDYGSAPSSSAASFTSTVRERAQEEFNKFNLETPRGNEDLESSEGKEIKEEEHDFEKIGDDEGERTQTVQPQRSGSSFLLLN